VFAFCIVMTWYFPRLAHFVPRLLAELMYPIDKTNLDVLRFAHFLALAAITVWLIPRDWPGLKWLGFRPAILCGQHSLEIFCLGVFLSFAAHFVIITFGGGVAMQVLVSVLGVAIMIATAWMISWYKSIEGRGAAPRQKPPDANPVGGEA
jgi:hypothetical protein